MSWFDTRERFSGPKMTGLFRLVLTEHTVQWFRLNRAHCCQGTITLTETEKAFILSQEQLCTLLDQKMSVHKWTRAAWALPRCDRGANRGAVQACPSAPFASHPRQIAGKPLTTTR